MPPTLRLLGTLALGEKGAAGDAPVSLRLDRPMSLLVYLAVRGEWVMRSELAFLYRPDAPEAEALAYLRKIIFRARRSPLAWALELDETRLRWAGESDVRGFRDAVADGAWSEAVTRYGGPFLGGQTLASVPGFALWVEAERESLEAQWQLAASRYAEELEQKREYQECARLLERVLRTDPLAEDSLHSYMRVLAAAGQRERAHRAYREFRANLERELGIAPLEATQALADSIREAPATVGWSTRGRAALPAPTTGFIGRRSELARIEALVAKGEARLLTLIGLGGSGKTRLAIEAARMLAPRFADGAAFVSLVAVADAQRVAPALIEALALPWNGSDAEEALVAGLADSELLLVIDNFEGVLEAAPLLVRILEAAPRLTIVVTSREALAVQGEWLLDLHGLEVPHPGAGEDPERSDAVRLFVQRASRAIPDFTPTRANLEAVTDICRRVDGMPLAIELAAGWTRTLSPQQLRNELEGNWEIFTATTENLPERHRSLWSVFDYTWERLSPEEQELLPRLTVFRGGFTLEAAQEVAGARLPVLLRLMNRSLVRRPEEGRFELHELVRQYFASRFDARDAVLAHARYFGSSLQRLTADLKGSDPIGAVDRVHRDWANVEQAWDYALSSGDIALLDASRDALDYYCHYRSWGSGARLFTRAVKALETRQQAKGGRRLYGRMLAHLAPYERSLGEPELARRHAEAAVEILLVEGTDEDVAHARISLIGSELLAAEYGRAEELALDVLQRGVALADLYLQGSAHNILANLISYTSGDLSRAEEHYRQSLAANQELGNLEGVNAALINLGACRFDAHDFEGAARLWQEAAAIAQRLGYVQRLAVLHNNLGSLAESNGDSEGARTHYAKSLAVRREIGDRPGVANVLHNLGRLQYTLGRHEEAMILLQEALEICLQLKDRAAIAQTRSTLARVHMAQGRLESAQEQVQLALEIAHASNSRGDMMSALLSRSQLHELKEMGDEALRVAAFVEREAKSNEEVLRREAASLRERLEAHLPAEVAARVIDGLPRVPLTRFVASEIGS